MVVKDDRGFKVWGTCSQKLQDQLPLVEGATYELNIEASVGLRVQFTAQVDQADDDTKFGFFKRPQNALVLDEGPGEPSVPPMTREEIRDEITGDWHEIERIAKSG
jgi:hypothetical protein